MPREPREESRKQGAEKSSPPPPAPPPPAPLPPSEVGGPKGPEPTRYGDWEKNGICSDF